MFYLIEVSYVGPNHQPDHLISRVRIQTKPGHKNLSGEQCEKGWLGTTSNWNHQALGKMDEGQARQTLKKYGVKIPNSSPIKAGDYSYGGEHSEWHNSSFQY